MMNNYITLYRYIYKNEKFKMDKFEYCEVSKLDSQKYLIYKGESNTYFLGVVRGLDEIKYDYIMWSLSPNKKEYFLDLIITKQEELYNKAIQKANNHLDKIKTLELLKEEK